MQTNAGCAPAACDGAGDAIGIAEMGELVTQIYQGPLETPPWRSALELIRRALDASYVTLVLRAAANDRRVPLTIHASESRPVGVDREDTPYNRDFYAIDPFVGLPSDRVVTVDEVFGATAWVASELYRTFLQPLDIRHVLGADLRTQAGVECRFRVCRKHAAAPFSARDKARCGWLLPHLKGAVELHARLDAVAVERTLYANAVDRMQIAMITLDRHGMIVDANDVAGDLLAQRNGLIVTRDTIEATDAQDNRRLQRLIRRAVAGHLGTAAAPAEAMAVTRGAGKPRVGVLVRTIALSDWSGDSQRRPAVSILLRDPDRKPSGEREILRKLYDLTPAETALALRLTDGLTLDEAAEESGIRKNTARAHLRSIFSKTGVSRQATLVRILLGSVVPLG
ncbi:helix-turn-helix transcriptional regulator [Burkholderia sp. JKS000303]|uniref:helix-turn-helix transcriptional regulator n=1 Tax=Burkholderia sp. JKS000303 TaxID=1938747 RepID=UPI000BF39403|nr:helix-turn-helix transcriptional regulator [Burkholderia sp. JKS000303]PFH20121.1 DNA-binding CsgD family transcriptional regulator [Burkholderia sp. JKS000303]